VSDYQEHPLLLVIFGISGNLARRKLMPALYHLLQRGDLPSTFRVVGISRKDYQIDQLFSDISSYLPKDLDTDVLDSLKHNTVITHLDLSENQAYEALHSELVTASNELGGDTTRLYYLSIPAQAFGGVVRSLGETGHNLPFEGETIR